jgi:hypothetical protein
MDQKQSKIYISSSELGYTLAKKLRDQLDEPDFTSVTLWKDYRDEASSTVIEMLEKAKDEFDFAVIILTREDMVVKKAGEEKIPQARDNCFYEAGLFMGSLKRDRCFLVSSVNDLPEDLSGITIRRFDPPADLANETECTKAMTKPAARILEYVQKKGPKDKLSCFQILSPDIIFERESKLAKDQVIVNAKRPFEAAEFKRAVQVKKNMDKKNIYYKYFFYAQPGGAKSICQFLQNILLVDLIKEEDIKNTENFTYRCEKINNNLDEVLATLWDICNFGRLRIYFFQTIPPFEFCIHNADTNDAKAYIKYEDKYLEWYNGLKANDFANSLWGQLEKCCLREPPRALFMNTHCLTVLDQEIIKNLDEEINKHFSNISEQVKNICYHGWILPFIDGKGGGIKKGDTIKGAISKASAVVSWIKLDKGGSWAKKNAAGKLILKSQEGTFQQEEDLIVGRKKVAKAKGYERESKK